MINKNNDCKRSPYLSNSKIISSNFIDDASRKLDCFLYKINGADSKISKILSKLIEILRIFPDLNKTKQKSLLSIYERVGKIDSLFKSVESQIFRHIVETPKIKIELSDAILPFYTSSFIEGSGLLRAILNHNSDMKHSGVMKLKQFSQDDLLIAKEVLQKNSTPSLEHAWVLLHLASQMDSKRLSDACAEAFRSNIDKMEIDTVLTLFNETILDEFPNISKIFENKISAFVGSKLNDPKFETIINELKIKIKKTFDLNLSRQKFGMSQIIMIEKLPLHKVSFNCCFAVDIKCLKRLQNMPKLREVEVSFTQVDNEVIQGLPDTLHLLNIGACRQITDEIKDKIASMSLLKVLNCSFTLVTDETIKHLPLGLIDLSVGSNKRVTDGVKNRLSQMKALKRLSLTATSITDETVKMLPKGLNHLDLTGCETVTDQSKTALLEMKNLKSLFLSGTSLEPLTISELKRAFGNSCQIVY